MSKDNKQGMEDIPMHTALNAEYMMTATFHPNNILQDDTVYAGDSVDKHVSLENANEYLAQKEIGQINNNS